MDQIQKTARLRETLNKGRGSYKIIAVFVAGFLCGVWRHVLANPWLWAGVFCATLLLLSIWMMILHRREMVKKMWPARFFAASLFINALFILLLFLWKLPGIVEAIVQQFQEPTPSSRVVDPNELQSERTRENVYSKVEDLPAMEPDAAEWPSDVVPQNPIDPTQSLPPLPEDVRLPVSESLPSHVKQTVVAVVPRPMISNPEQQPVPQKLSRPVPKQPTVLLPSEPVPQLAKVSPKPLEDLPATEPLAKQQTASVELPIPETRKTFAPQDPKPQLLPLPALSKTEQLPVAKRMVLDVPKRSKKEPKLQQIANVENTVFKPVQNPKETQILPSDAPPLDRKQPVMQTAFKLPEEKPNYPAPPERKLSAANPKLNRTVPKLAGLPLTQSPELLKTQQPANQLAKVEEVVPTFKPISPSEANPSVELAEQSSKVVPSPPQLSETEAITKPPELSLPQMQPTKLAKSFPPRKLPNGSKPKLGRFALARNPSPEALESPSLVEVRETIELPSMLALRNPETRKEMAKALGTHPAEEAAVKRGLLWLAKHQNEDGSWSLNDYHVNCKKHGGKCTGAGSERSNTAATGLAILPFLASGYTPQSQEYGVVVQKGLDWLIKNQDKEGKLQGPGDNQIMYSHGIASIALCEAFAMTKDPKLGDAAKKAITFIVNSQHKSSGGWRYKPNESADTSVVGWQVMALKSAEMAGIIVPPACYQNVRNWLAKVEGQKPEGGVFGYTNQSPTPAMSAEGLLCLEFLSEPSDSSRLANGSEYLLKYLPRPDQRHTSYYWYYATQALYHRQGEAWESWNPGLRKILLDTQEKSGHTNGTWKPKDNWEKRGGRIYATSLKLLMLEIEYRHLPLYGIGR